MKLANKVVVITGAAAGIGKAAVKKCLAEGAQVVASDYNEQAVFELQASPEISNNQLMAQRCDVTQQSDIDALIKQTLERFGQVDTVVNSAGISNRGFPADMPLTEVWQRIMDVNAKGAMLMCEAVLGHMRERRSGSIINIGSVMSTVVHHHDYELSTGFNPYQQSKGAVLQFTRDFAVQQAKHNIRANCVCPGFINTELTAPLVNKPELHKKIEAMHPMGRFGEAEEVANAIAFLASDEASFITGTALYVDGGYTAV